MAEIADIYVFAPDRNRSGASNSLTLTNPIRIQEIEPGWFSVQGTPTDCVHLALTGVLDFVPDMVISGINAGANMGEDVWYSGTVAAAMEGRFMGIPSIAMSLHGKDLTHYETAAVVAKRLVQRMLKDPLPTETILNVNVPDIPLDQFKGAEVTRTGQRHHAEPCVATTDPRGRPIYWFGEAGKEKDASLGTDFHAVANDKASITPLRVDLTRYKVFDQLSQWVQSDPLL
jgi:5'-nucleotidase